MSRLKSRVALVSGSAQGIGKGIAGALANAGALVALWDINDLVHETAEDINRLGGKAFSYVVNVADPDQVEDTAKQIANKLGKIDILVNNAAIARFAPFVDMTDSVRDEVINVNFYGMWNCSKAAIPIMVK